MKANGKIHRITGLGKYIVNQDLEQALTAAMHLEQPLLVKGEPGTGKTVLAEVIAEELGFKLFPMTVKSTTRGIHLLYELDHLSRLRLIEEIKIKQLTRPDEVPALLQRLDDISNFIVPGVLWRAFANEEQSVLLLDEFDKADTELPNDLLRELDRMEIVCHETGQVIRPVQRPIVIITSNNERELPPAFLRRCVFVYIPFPSIDGMRQIIEAHFPGAPERVIAKSLELFYKLREMGFSKRPSTAELLNWLALILSDQLGGAGVLLKTREISELPFAGALLKDERDLSRLANNIR